MLPCHLLIDGWINGWIEQVSDALFHDPATLGVLRSASDCANYINIIQGGLILIFGPEFMSYCKLFLSQKSNKELKTFHILLLFYICFT